MERISLKQVNNSERFFRVPKQLFESNIYKRMSADSKLLYAILKDRFELSIKNNWIDEDGNIYFIFTVEEIGDMLGCGKDKVIKLKKELKKYNLLEEARQGLNKPNLIYLGSLRDENVVKPLGIAEVGKSESNDTEYSETNNKDTELVICEEDEENFSRNSSNNKQDSLSRKVDKASRYDKDYIYDLIYSQLLKDDYSDTLAAYIMMQFEERYKYALENMRFAHSSEMVAEYVYNGLLAIYNSNARKRMGNN